MKVRNCKHTLEKGTKQKKQNQKRMMESKEDYETAAAELQQFLDAPKPPPVGSVQAQRFEALLDALEAYEDAMSKASPNDTAQISHGRPHHG